MRHPFTDFEEYFHPTFTAKDALRIKVLVIRNNQDNMDVSFLRQKRNN